MEKKRIQLLSVICLVLFGCLLTGCIEERIKEVLTDQSGTGESSVSITQSAKIAFTGFSTKKVGCGSQLSIQVSIMNRDIVRDHFVFVDKGVMIEDLKPISVRSGDQAKLKIVNGCPDVKYTINFSLDSGE